MCEIVNLQAVVIGELKQEVAGLQKALQESFVTSGELDQLRQKLAALDRSHQELTAETRSPRPAARTTPASVIVSEPKIALPEKYNGVDGKCEVFLINVDLVSELEPRRTSLLSTLRQAAEWAPVGQLHGDLAFQSSHNLVPSIRSQVLNSGCSNPLGRFSSPNSLLQGAGESADD